MAKVYTKTGDKGTTGLYGGQRVSKSSLRLESYGTVDELNAYIGLLKDLISESKYQSQLLIIQHNLFRMGAFLATPLTSENIAELSEKMNLIRFTSKDVELLESYIDEMQAQLSPMTHFLLPGGHVVVSHCHIARTICRRAERNVVGLTEEFYVEELILVYLNRLSDYLFVLARMLSKLLAVDEIKWIPS